MDVFFSILKLFMALACGPFVSKKAGGREGGEEEEERQHYDVPCLD